MSMKRHLVILACVAMAFAAAPGALANHFEGYTTISSNSSGGLISAMNVVYIFDSVVCPECTYQVIGNHRIRESNGGGTVTQMQWGVMGVSYRNNLDGAGAPGSCYFASGDSTLLLYGCAGCPIPAPGGPYTWDTGGPWDSATTCITAPAYHDIRVCTIVDGTYHLLRTERYQQGTSLQFSPETPSQYAFTGWSGFVNSSQQTITFIMPGYDTEQCANFSYIGGGGGGGGGDDGSGTYNEDMPCFPGIDPNCYSSPVIINLEKGSYRLTGSDAPVVFDIAGNGHPHPMGWTAAEAEEAFLWLDRNDDGTVNSGVELFGNFTPLQNGQLARNGFEALREFDTNADGVINKQDPIWSRLMLWRDLNHNGISAETEILPIAESGVIAIDLNYHWSGRHDKSGNLFKYESLVSIMNRSGSGIHKQPVYDIFFAPVPYVP
jgi:hypothetical protein